MAKAKTVSQGSVQSDQEKRAARAIKRVEKFKAVAPKRVTNALRALDRVIQTSNRGRYTFDESQAAKIVEAIVNRAAKVNEAFTAAASATKEQFSL